VQHDRILNPNSLASCSNFGRLPDSESPIERRARRRPRHAGLAVICLSALVGLLVSNAGAQVYTYAYDELGRLIAVVDPSGNAGVYNYDSVGNLLSITNTTASTVSIFTFTPNNGTSGITVTIYGDGFSTTPSQNTVTFNGKFATVTASTVATITTSVPTGATNGPIKVTNVNGTATSSESFMVN
jgi:YD repeat-containing protein